MCYTLNTQQLIRKDRSSADIRVSEKISALCGNSGAGTCFIEQPLLNHYKLLVALIDFYKFNAFNNELYIKYVPLMQYNVIYIRHTENN